MTSAPHAECVRESSQTALSKKEKKQHVFFLPAAVDTTKDPCQNVKCSRNKMCVAHGYQRAMCVSRKKVEHRYVESVSGDQRKEEEGQDKFFFFFCGSAAFECPTEKN